jgi:hypothetical protein
MRQYFPMTEADVIAALEAMRGKPAPTEARRAFQERNNPEAAAARALARHRGRPAYVAKKSLSAMIRTLMKERGIKPGVRIEVIQATWAEIVGEAIARMTWPEKLTGSKAGGTLTIRVTPSAALIVQHDLPQIMEKLSLALGEDRIGKVNLVQGNILRPKAPAKRQWRSLDAGAKAEIAAKTGDIQSSDLKEALLRLGEAIAEQRINRDP